MSELRDPRVFFAAERTLLAWNRTCLALMGFGFVIERFGLFLRYGVVSQADAPPQGLAPWIGIAFILLGSALSLLSVRQYRGVLRTLNPAEVPVGYWTGLGVLTNMVVALLGLLIALHLLYQHAAGTG